MKKKLLMFICSIVFLIVACQNTEEPSQKDTTESKSTFQEGEQDKMENDELSLPSSMLEKEDESDDVHLLQQVLTHLDYPIDINGTYDDLTTWAITDIQLQLDLIVTGMYDQDTKTELESMLEDETATIKVGANVAEPEHPNDYPDIVENPYDVLALVNKNHALPSDYEPEDLVVPEIRFPFEEDVPKKKLRKVAADAIEELFEAGDEAGISLFGQSGFRSYDRQEAIFASNAEQNGEEHANTYSARAGESEHQTGLVMDITSQSVDFDLITDFGETEEGKWLQEHAHEYGFIIRYPEEKEEITQYQYEPWHLRYVGEKAAREMYDQSETLEEYLGVE